MFIYLFTGKKYPYSFVYMYIYIYVVPPKDPPMWAIWRYLHRFSHISYFKPYGILVVKRMHFLATCCNPTLPTLHRIQDSRSRIRLVESKRGRIQDSNFLNPKELDSRFKIQTNFFNPRLNLESWIQRGWTQEVFSEPWILKLDSRYLEHCQPLAIGISSKCLALLLRTYPLRFCGVAPFHFQHSI